MCPHKVSCTNQIKLYLRRIQPYREMLTYKPLTNNAVQEIEFTVNSMHSRASVRDKILRLKRERFSSKSENAAPYPKKVKAWSHMDLPNGQ